MKSILLTSTALVAFAGAAVADGHATPGITFAGEATLGYNTDDGVNDPVLNDGFFWDAEVDVTMTAALDNGLVATATFGLNVVEDSLTDPVVTSDYVLSLTGGNASLTFGDVDPVAEDRWGGVDGESTVGFNDQDAHFDVVGFESILVGEATLYGFTGAVSFGIDSDGAAGTPPLAAGVEDIDALQVYVSGTVSIVDLEFAYQQELGDLTPDIFGLSASTTVAGADLTVAYLQNSELAVAGIAEESSIGLAAAYPIGPVTVSAYYSINDVAEDNFGGALNYSANGIAVNVEVDVTGNDPADDLIEYLIEGSYEVGGGLTVLAGYLSDDSANALDEFYVAGEYDLGGGAQILVSYADDGDETGNITDDEVGDPEYMEGTTIEVSFEF